MKFNVMSLISRIKEAANDLIINELKLAGYNDIVPSHGDILYILYDSKEISMKEIASKIHRTKATTTVLVDKLEKLGLVVRIKSEADSRCTLVKLTDQGKKFKPVFENISIKLNKKVYAGISQKNAELLELLLGQVRKNLE